jgi:hypothetical protein
LQRSGRAQLVTAVCGDDQDAALADGVCEEGDEVEGRGVGPVEVLEHEQEWRSGTQPLEDGEQLLEQLELRVAGDSLRIHGRRRCGQLGDEPRELG